MASFVFQKRKTSLGDLDFAAGSVADRLLCLAMESNISQIISETISELFDMLGHGEAGFIHDSKPQCLTGVLDYHVLDCFAKFIPLSPMCAGIDEKSEINGESASHLSSPT